MGFDSMINFNNCKEVACNYGGSEKKKKIIYNGDYYLLKFPDPIREKNREISYMNNNFSEYVGCKIFESIGIPVQQVLIGEYTEKKSAQSLEKNKVVVACKDFTTPTKKLIEFSDLANSITSMDKHFTPDIRDIKEVLDNVNYKVNKEEIMNRFWEVFVVDALIANTDRHLSNWGLFEENGKLSPADVYDCGSSLHPLLSDDEMKNTINDKDKFRDECYNVYPIYKYNGKKLTYLQFFKKNIPELTSALKRILPKIDLDKINNIIDETPYMSDIRKAFFKKSIAYRKENILDSSLKTIVKHEEKEKRKLKKSI